MLGTRANAISNVALGAKWRGEDQWLIDGGTRGAGRLVARLRGEDGWHFFFQYFDSDDKRRLWPIGPYDPSGKRGVSLQAARDRAAELSKLYRGGVREIHAYFKRELEAEERARKTAEEAAQRAEQDARRSTLRQLLDAYVAHLGRAGKQSSGDVRRIFNKHVYQAAPDVAERRAHSPRRVAGRSLLAGDSLGARNREQARSYMTGLGLFAITPVPGAPAHVPQPQCAWLCETGSPY